MTNPIKKWRPEGWDEIKKEYRADDIPDEDGIYDDEFSAGFECGADAMLKVCREKLDKIAFLLVRLYDQSN